MATWRAGGRWGAARRARRGSVPARGRPPPARAAARSGPGEAGGGVEEGEGETDLGDDEAGGEAGEEVDDGDEEREGVPAVEPAVEAGGWKAEGEGRVGRREEAGGGTGGHGDDVEEDGEGVEEEDAEEREGRVLGRQRLDPEQPREQEGVVEGVAEGGPVAQEDEGDEDEVDDEGESKEEEVGQVARHQVRRVEGERHADAAAAAHPLLLTHRPLRHRWLCRLQLHRISLL